MNIERRQADLQRELLSDELLDLEGLGKLSAKLYDLGNLFNQHLAGKSGWIFWETADKLSQIQSRLQRGIAGEDIDEE